MYYNTNKPQRKAKVAIATIKRKAVIKKVTINKDTKVKDSKVKD